MMEKGYKGGLVSRVRNQYSGRKYIISTAQEIKRDYWSSVIMGYKFFNLFPDFFNPLYTFIRNNMDDAYVVHEELKKIVKTIPENKWLELSPHPSPLEGYSEGAKNILGKFGL